MFVGVLSLGSFASVLWLNSQSILLIFPLGLQGNSSLFEMSFCLDSVSCLFLGVLCMVVLVILLFSDDYLGSDMLFSRFMLILYSFVISMGVLLVSSNLLFLLMGWDGLGVTSFLLMCFYKTASSWSSSLKTFLINRLGDGMILCVVCIALGQGEGSGGIWSGAVSLVFCFGVLTKSAKFPFSSWLPAAMAAPTPVSALVHSSTLVTAGVYLLVRFYKELSEGVGVLLSTLSLWTIMVASMAAFVEQDLKKVIAFSTLSQLGVMVYCISNGFLSLTVFHLFTHALFKANMFICAGYFLMNQSHQQDFRGISFGFSPLLLSISFMVSTMNLKGGVFLSGFYSKDSVLDSDVWGGKLVVSSVFLVSLIGTVGYSFRLVYGLAVGMSSVSFHGHTLQTYVPLWLTGVSMCFGSWVFSDFFSSHTPPLMFKLVPPIFLVGFGTFCLFTPQLLNSVWASGIGGLKFFKADSFLGKVSQVGLTLNNTLDKGVLNPEVFPNHSASFNSVPENVYLYWGGSVAMGSIGVILLVLL